MDKNTIIGFVLIGIVLFGFSWLNRPTPEQIEAQRRYQDSIAQIEMEKQAEQEKQHEMIAENRRSQVGSGDRSERIRTYNFPQGRVTDHRINLTLYKLDAVMEGDIQELVDALVTHAQTEALKSQTDV